MHQSNGYRPIVINRWMGIFNWQLRTNPVILNLPVHPENNLSLSLDHSLGGSPGVPTPWVPTVISPYVPGTSERLHSLAAKYGIRNWMSYGGKLSDRLCCFKDQFHQSKCQNAVYSVSCLCGMRYVGETARNLKIWIHEHTLKSSKSTTQNKNNTIQNNTKTPYRKKTTKY